MKKALTLLLAVVLAFGTALVQAAPAEAAKSTRTAQVVEVQGDVHITKSGGTKQFRVFKGMTLNQGDYLVTGQGAKVVLVIADREDEVTVGENASLYISELSETAEGSKSKFKTWAGSIWNKVSALVGAEDEFEVETPTAVMGVRGTHFYVVVDPLTGTVTLTVASGVVETRPEGGDKAAAVMPLRVFQWFADGEMEDPEDAVTFMDLDAFFAVATPDIIEKMILETAKLHDEIEQLREAWEENPDIGEPPSPEDLTNVFTHIINEAVNRGVITAGKAESLVNQANEQISSETRQYHLESDPPPMEQTAGVDWEKEAQNREKRNAANEASQEKREEKLRRKQEAREANPDVAQAVEETRNRQQEVNQQVEEERKQQAVEDYASGLTEAERQQLEQRRAEREEERRRQQEAAGQNGTQQPAESGTGTGGSGGSGGGGGGGGGGGSDTPGESYNAVATIRDVNWLNPEPFEPYLGFTLDLKLKNINALFGAQVHVTMPDGWIGFGPNENDPWAKSNIFKDNAVTHWKVAEEGIEFKGKPADQLILAAMLLPDANPVKLEEETLLLSTTIRFNAYQVEGSSIPVRLHLILADEDGNEIEARLAETELSVPLPALPASPALP